MTDRLLASDAGSAALPDEVPAGTQVLAGTPVAAVRPLGTFGEAEVGVWELTPGTVRDVEADEVFVVLGGRGTVTFADGEVLELVAGTVVRLRAGERTEWTVTQTLRKVYVSR